MLRGGTSGRSVLQCSKERSIATAGGKWGIWGVGGYPGLGWWIVGGGSGGSVGVEFGGFGGVAGSALGLGWGSGRV
jgi:hypothetical protein